MTLSAPAHRLAPERGQGPLRGSDPGRLLRHPAGRRAAHRGLRTSLAAACPRWRASSCRTCTPPRPSRGTAPVADPPTFAGATLRRSCVPGRPPAGAPLPAGRDGLRLDPLDATDARRRSSRSSSSSWCPAPSCSRWSPSSTCRRGSPRGRSCSGGRASTPPARPPTTRGCEYRSRARRVAAGLGAPVGVRGRGHRPVLSSRTGFRTVRPTSWSAGAVDVTDRVDPASTRCCTRAASTSTWLRHRRRLADGRADAVADPAWRQLNVRRVVSLVERTWSCPSCRGRCSSRTTARSAAGVELLLAELLRQLFAQGASRARPRPSRTLSAPPRMPCCRWSPTSASSSAEIGLAVAEPLEFILVRVLQRARGAQTTETVRWLTACSDDLFPLPGLAPLGRRPRAVPRPRAVLGRGFQECTGLEVEMDASEYPEGGSNNAVVQRAGRAKYTIVLQRGMFAPAGGQVDTELWQWLQDVVDGVRPIRRYDGTVEVLGESRSRSPPGPSPAGCPRSSSARSSTRTPARWRSRSCTSPTRDSGWRCCDGRSRKPSCRRSRRNQPRRLPIGPKIEVQVNPTSMRLAAGQHGRLREGLRAAEDELPGLVLDAFVRPRIRQRGRGDHRNPGRRADPHSPARTLRAAADERAEGRTAEGPVHLRLVHRHRRHDHPQPRFRSLLRERGPASRQVRRDDQGAEAGVRREAGRPGSRTPAAGATPPFRPPRARGRHPGAGTHPAGRAGTGRPYRHGAGRRVGTATSPPGWAWTPPPGRGFRASPIR